MTILHVENKIGKYHYTGRKLNIKD